MEKSKSPKETSLQKPFAEAADLLQEICNELILNSKLLGKENSNLSWRTAEGWFAGDHAPEKLNQQILFDVLRRKATKENVDIEGKIVQLKIKWQLRPKFIDEFTAHLDNLIDMVQGANRSFHSYVDCCDYGSFSAPERHDAFLKEIENSMENKNGFSVKMMISASTPEPISKASPFYRKSMDELLKNNEFKEALSSFLNINPEFRDRKLHTYTDLTKMLQVHQENIHRRLAGKRVLISGIDGAPIEYGNVDGALPEQSMESLSLPFFWIADDESAIILNPDYPRQQPITRKEDVVARYSRFFKQHWKDPP